MKVTLESTDKIIEVEIDGATVPARVWEGKSESGVPVIALITGISPQTDDAEANAAFASELRDMGKPIMFPTSFNGRMIFD